MRTIEEIKADLEMLESFGINSVEMHDRLIGYLEELLNYKQAERDGRCVVLPCKVGDTVYVISKCENVHMCRDDDYFTGTGAIECPFEKDCEFEECDDGNTRVFETTIRGGWVEENHICVFCDTLNFEIVQSDIGKTVFLTREEAEKALKGGAE